MRPTVPAFPVFGEPVRSAGPCLSALELMAARRSGPAQDLAAPGPDRGQIEDLLRLAARVPDHGKLFPWRFVVMQGEGKAALVERLRPLSAAQADPVKAGKVLAKLANPPVSVLVVSRAVPHKVPEWEQRLSAGAVCMNLLLAAEAMGFAANWITDWYAYDAKAGAILGLGDGEKVAGFIHLGALAEPPLERVRPSMEELTVWL